MNVRQREVVILLNEEGYDALQLAIPELPDSRVASFYAEDTDEMGLWVRIPRTDGDHLLLIRWDFILTIDMAAARTKTMGLKA